MKKQILFLAFFTLAIIFAGTNSSYAQQYKNPTASVWVAPTCTSSATTPAAGEPYTYTVSVPSTYAGYNGDGNYDWYVTQDVNLLNLTAIETPGTEFIVASGAGLSPYNAATGTTDDIRITWTAASIGQGAYYLVVDYNEVNTDGTKACDINNIKVYAILPRNTFWLDINASDNLFAIPGTAPTTYDICAPAVSSAVITPNADPTLATVKYEYGITNLYAVIHAAGYTGDFNATLTVSGIAGSQRLTSITVGGVAWTAGAVDVNGNGPYTATLPALFAGSNYNVALAITNNQHENLTDQPIKISIDGSYTANSVTYNDLSDENGACTPEDVPVPATATGDYVVETIKARPAVNPINPAAFVVPAPILD